MSITIYYNGKMEDRARLTEMLDAARLYCAEQRWASLEIQERIIGSIERLTEQRELPVETTGAQSHTSEILSDLFPVDDTMHGLLITVHRNAEPLRLTFNEAGEMIYYMALNDDGVYLENKLLFTQTQLAGVNIHIAVCEFLHWLNDTYMPDLNVYDQGDYYESGDAQKLARAFSNTNMMTARVQTVLVESESDDPGANDVRDFADPSASDNIPEGEPPETPRKKRKVERVEPSNVPGPNRKTGRGLSADKN